MKEILIIWMDFWKTNYLQADDKVKSIPNPERENIIPSIVSFKPNTKEIFW